MTGYPSTQSKWIWTYPGAATYVPANAKSSFYTSINSPGNGRTVTVYAAADGRATLYLNSVAANSNIGPKFTTFTVNTQGGANNFTFLVTNDGNATYSPAGLIFAIKTNNGNSYVDSSASTTQYRVDYKDTQFPVREYPPVDGSIPVGSLWTKDSTDMFAGYAKYKFNTSTAGGLYGTGQYVAWADRYI